MDGLLWDVRHALRSLTRAPGFALVAILTLALGIGANSAIFSLYDEVLLRPLPVRAPGELAQVQVVYEDGGTTNDFSYPEYLDLANAKNPDVHGMVAFSPITAALESPGGDGAVRVLGAQVSGNTFGVLGVRTALGRPLTPADDQFGAEPVVVIAWDLWQRQFGGDPTVVGRVLRFNQVPCRVIGVAARGFRGTMRGYAAQFWVALHPAVKMTGDISAFGAIDRLDENVARTMRWLTVTGRVTPGRTDAVRPRLEADWHRRMTPGTDRLTQKLAILPAGRGDTSLLQGPGRISAMLMALVVLLLTIACANVAGLLLARTEGRRREIGIRLALGGSRGRIVRQFACESLMLSIAGGALGLLIANWMTDALRVFTPPSPWPLELAYSLDARVLLFTAAVTLLGGLALGVGPAWSATRTSVLGSLRRDPGAGWFSRRPLAPRRLLVAGQVALSVVLLAAAGLFLRTLWNERAIPLGFDPNHCVAVSIDPSATDWDRAAGNAFYRDLLTRARELPGVESVTLVQFLPPSIGGSNFGYGAGDLGAGMPEIDFDVNTVGAGYFATLRMPLVQGHDLTLADALPGKGQMKRAVINESLARKLWPGQNPVGRTLAMFGPDQPPVEIVGVAKDARYRELREPQRRILYLADPVRAGGVTVVARTAPGSGNVLPAITALIREIDPRIALYGSTSLEDHVAQAMVATRFASLLLAVFAMLALLLSALGLYGLVAYAVERRTREIGLRIAFGATPGRVLRMILGESLAIAAPGLVIGIGLALALSRLVASLLYGVSPVDPATYGAMVVLLLVALLFASWVPGRRAARLEPMAALREE